jgi:DNA-binding transcriptional LysR family regulator
MKGSHLDRFIGMAVFAKVVESASFAAAARHFAMSPAMVSKHIRTLEERLGVRLLNRTTRHVSATEVGQNYYERCLRILNELEDAERAAGDLEAAPRGLLRVTTSVSFGAHQLAPAIADYLIAYPNVSIDLSLHDNYVDLVEERIDLAIRLGQLSDSSLIAKKLYAVEMVLCASPGYLAANGTPQKPRDLVKHNCLIYTYATPRMWTFTDRNGKAEVIRVSGHLSANSGDPLLALALKDTGILLGPDYLVADGLSAGRLVRLLPDYKTQETPVYAVYPHSHFLPAKTRTFIDFLAARFAHPPGIKPNGRDGANAMHVPPDLRSVTDETRHPSAPSN